MSEQAVGTTVPGAGTSGAGPAGPSSGEAALVARELYRFFRAGGEETLALRGVSLRVRRGETVAEITGRRPALFRPPYGVMSGPARTATRRLGLTPCCGRAGARTGPPGPPRSRSTAPWSPTCTAEAPYCSMTRTAPPRPALGGPPRALFPAFSTPASSEATRSVRSASTDPPAPPASPRSAPHRPRHHGRSRDTDVRGPGTGPRAGSRGLSGTPPETTRDLKQAVEQRADLFMCSGRSGSSPIASRRTSCCGPGANRSLSGTGKITVEAGVWTR